MDLKIGIGYDVHKLVRNRPFILGSVVIPYKKGFLAHSDGDVLIHSIIDAILGAANLGDIGTLFPNNDPTYYNINSKILLEKTLSLIKKNKFKINNIDTTIICEKPKLQPYISRIKNELSKTMKLNEDNISIKSKTKEKIDSTGKGKAVEVFSICLLNKK